MSATVKTIIKDYLETNGYDGLCYNDCGCSVKDLMLCNSLCGKCEPAYKYIVIKDICEVCEDNRKCPIRDYADEDMMCFYKHDIPLKCRVKR
jgi:hypothetical protein